MTLRAGREMGGGVPYVYEKLNQTVCCWHIFTQSYVITININTLVKSFPPAQK